MLHICNITHSHIEYQVTYISQSCITNIQLYIIQSHYVWLHLDIYIESHLIFVSQSYDNNINFTIIYSHIINNQLYRESLRRFQIFVKYFDSFLGQLLHIYFNLPARESFSIKGIAARKDLLFTVIFCTYKNKMCFIFYLILTKWAEPLVYMDISEPSSFYF